MLPRNISRLFPNMCDWMSVVSSFICYKELIKDEILSDVDCNGDKDTFYWMESHVANGETRPFINR